MSENNTLTDAQRLQKVLDELKLNAHSMAVSLSYKSHATVYHVLNGENNLSQGMIAKIIERYPQVNYAFLKHGEGEVLLDEIGKKNQMNFFNIGEKNPFVSFGQIPDKLDRLIELQEEGNELLRKLHDVLLDK